ncbi:MAG: sigma-70 family RNA polymerase sigma factor, partial [Bacteroidota bacterium]
EGSDAETMDRKDTISQLHRAMGSLSTAKREILVLSKFKEMKFSEIGEVLGCSEGAAKVKAHRALNDLKMAFEKMQIT